MSLNLTALLESFVRERDCKLNLLRDAIAEGDEAISRGESDVFNSAEELDRFFAEL